MAYDESLLSPIDPASIEWATAFTRFLLRDTSEPYSLASAEVRATLETTAVTVDEATYYRPHMAAAALIRSDPDRVVSERIDNASAEYVNPAVLAARIERDWSSIDDRIKALSGVNPGGGRTFRAVW